MVSSEEEKETGVNVYMEQEEEIMSEVEECEKECEAQESEEEESYDEGLSFFLRQ